MLERLVIKKGAFLDVSGGAGGEVRPAGRPGGRREARVAAARASAHCPHAAAHTGRRAAKTSTCLKADELYIMD